MAGETIRTITVEGGSAQQLRNLTVFYQISKTIGQTDVLKSAVNGQQTMDIGSMSQNFGKAMQQYFAQALNDLPDVAAVGSLEGTKAASAFNNSATITRKGVPIYSQEEVTRLRDNSKQIAKKTAESVNEIVTQALNSPEKIYMTSTDHTAPVDAIAKGIKSSIKLGIEIKSQYGKGQTGNRIKFSDKVASKLWGLNYSAWLKSRNYWYTEEEAKIIPTASWVKSTRGEWYGEFLGSNGWLDDAAKTLAQILSKGSLNAEDMNKFIVVMRATVAGRNVNATHESSLIHVGSMVEDLKKHPERLTIKAPSDKRLSLGIQLNDEDLIYHQILSFHGNFNKGGTKVGEPTFNTRTFLYNKALDEFDLLNKTIVEL